MHDRLFPSLPLSLSRRQVSRTKGHGYSGGGGGGGGRGHYRGSSGGGYSSSRGSVILNEVVCTQVISLNRVHSFDLSTCRCTAYTVVMYPQVFLQ